MKKSIIKVIPIVLVVALASVTTSLAQDGTQKWVFVAGGWSSSLTAPAIGADGTIYVGSFPDGNLIAINSDGTEKWKLRVALDSPSIPAIGEDGTIYVGSDIKDGYLFKLQITPTNRN